MKQTWVRDLQTGMEINEVFVLRSKELRDYEKGNYLKLELGDKTGRVDGVAFDNAVLLFRKAEEGDFVQVRGFTSTYKDFVQVKVDNLFKVEPDKVDLVDFLPRSKRAPEELLESYRKEAESLKNSHLAQLLKNILADQEIVKGFQMVPGGKLWHHNYVGGLLQHTLMIVEFCKNSWELYELVDKDLLITGAFVHDLGKISQYEVSSFIDYSDEGRLIGHIVEGDSIVHEKIKDITDCS